MFSIPTLQTTSVSLFVFPFVSFLPLPPQDVMSVAMYPHVAKEFFKFRAKYGPVDRWGQEE